MIYVFAVTWKLYEDKYLEQGCNHTELPLWATVTLDGNFYGLSYLFHALSFLQCKSNQLELLI